MEKKFYFRKMSHSKESFSHLNVTFLVSSLDKCPAPVAVSMVKNGQGSGDRRRNTFPLFAERLAGPLAFLVSREKSVRSVIDHQNNDQMLGKAFSRPLNYLGRHSN